MNLIKYTLFLCLFSICCTAQENWKPLFINGDFENFQQLNGTANYTYTDGVVTGTTKYNTPNSFLATKKTYSDFILEFEVLIENGMNSGVQFRSQTKDNAPDGRVFGYQAEIETSYRKWAGGIYDEGRRGWIYPLSHNEKGQAAFVKENWNKYRIEAVGNCLKTWVNGIQCANVLDDKTAEGFIAFQVHAIGTKQEEGQQVKWRNVRILTENIEAALYEIKEPVFELSYLTNELTEQESLNGWELLWDGKTTNGWRSAKSDNFPKHGWEIKNDLLTGLKSDGGESSNGGDIITIEKYANFELCVDFKITEGANSGIKYLVDTKLNEKKGSAKGLEFQILDDEKHPDAKNGLNNNRTVGALYDLIPPENLTESNRNTKRFSQGNFNRARIIVRGGHVEHWLNEIKVVEYDRFSQAFRALISYSKYAKLDGFGQQKEGHILLQDHGDLVYFKNIKIRKL
ncbi:MAG: hypothetical protein ACI85O_002492 [Saprospiraceae bacterium]|jgi:hypothetical protein